MGQCHEFEFDFKSLLIELYTNQTAFIWLVKPTIVSKLQYIRIINRTCLHWHMADEELRNDDDVK